MVAVPEREVSVLDASRIDEIRSSEDFNRLLKQHHIEARRWRDIKP